MILFEQKTKVKAIIRIGSNLENITNTVCEGWDVVWHFTIVRKVYMTYFVWNHLLYSWFTSHHMYYLDLKLFCPQKRKNYMIQTLI